MNEFLIGSKTLGKGNQVVAVLKSLYKFWWYNRYVHLHALTTNCMLLYAELHLDELNTCLSWFHSFCFWSPTSGFFNHLKAALPNGPI